MKPPSLPWLVLSALFLRPSTRRPWRLIITIGGVAVGVASVLATWASSRAAVASLREGVVEIAGKARIEVSQPGGLLESSLPPFRMLAKDALVAPVVEEFALAPKLKDSIRVLGVDLLLDKKFRDLAMDTNGPSPSEWNAELLQEALAGRGAIVPESLARDLGARAGDKFTILSRSKPVEIVILTLLKPASVASAWNRTIILDIAYAQEMFGRVGRIDRLELLPRGSVTIEELEQRARDAAPAGALVAKPHERAETAGGMVKSLEFNLTALSGISLIVGTVLVATTLATSVIQRRSILALLRSLGATNLQIANAIFIEASAIGLLGGSLGVAAGAFGARFSLASARSTVAAVVQGLPESDIHIPWWAVVGGILLGWFVSLCAAILPLREALRTPPVQGLRRERPSFLTAAQWRSFGLLLIGLLVIAAALALAPPIGGLPYAALGSAFALLMSVLVISSPALDAIARLSKISKGIFSIGAVGRAAIAALSASRARAAWAAGAVGMAVALAIAIITMVGSFRETVFDYVNQTIRSDVWIRPRLASTGVQVGRLDPEIVKLAFEEFGPEVVDPFHETVAYYKNQPVSLCAGVYKVIQRAAGLPFRDGRDPKLVFERSIESNSIMVNEPFANKFGIREGDSIELSVPGRLLKLRVEAVFYDYSRSQGMVVIDRSDFLKIYPDDGPREIALFLKNGADAPAARDRFVNILNGRFDADVLLNKEIRAQALEAFDRTFAITKALEFVARIVAIVAVATVLSALVDERRHDFALLRALGGSKAQVTGMIVHEGFLLGLLSVTLGFLFGLLVGVVLVKIVNLQSFGWTMRFSPPWTAILSIVISVAVTCAAAALFPAWIAARRAPRELLQDDV